MKEMKTVVAVIAGAILAVCTAQAQTLLWYRFDGDGATIVNKASPGTMDGTLKSINTWGSLGGLGDTSSKFPTRRDAFATDAKVYDPATKTTYTGQPRGLSFSGNPDNSGTVRLLKADTTTDLKQMMSCTCEVFFKLPSDSAAIETRRAKDILFPLVDWGSPDGNGLGWFFGLRKDNSSTGFYPFFRSKHHNGSSAVQTDCQDKTYINDDKWHHLAVIITADTSANTATVKLMLDYTTLATTKTLSGFYGFHNNNGGNFPFLVGADLWRSSKSCCFMGEIAEVRVSNTALAPDELLRPLPPGPVDEDTLVYLPMGDADWFGFNTNENYYGIMNAVPDSSLSPYWFRNPSFPAVIPAMEAETQGATVRGAFLDTASCVDAKSIRFTRSLLNDKYAGHVLRIPYEGQGLAEDSFTIEWFFKTDGEVPTGNEINSYTFLNCSFAKIMINQANGKLLTRLVNSESWQDYNSPGRVDDGSWHHYALVYDKRQGAFSTYLDYKKINSETYTLTTVTSKAFCFGGQDRYEQVFSGNLDNLRITKRALKANEFLTSRPLVNADAALFAHFEDSLATGQDTVLAPDATGTGTNFVENTRKYDYDDDGRPDQESGKALSLGSIVWPHNSLLECRDFTLEWFGKYKSIASKAMLARFEMESGDAGSGTISWALYTPSNRLRLGAHYSDDGVWKKGMTRSDDNFTDNMDFADNRWHHYALVAKTEGGKTTFTFYRDWEQLGKTIELDGMLAIPTTGTRLTMGTGDPISGLIDELRFTRSALAPGEFIHTVPSGLLIIVR